MTTGLLGITASARGAAAPADEEDARGVSAAGLAQATSTMPTTRSTRLHSAGGNMVSTLRSEPRIRGVGQRPTPRMEIPSRTPSRRECSVLATTNTEQSTCDDLLCRHEAGLRDLGRPGLDLDRLGRKAQDVLVQV